MNEISRKEFLQQAGTGAAAVLLMACLGCKKKKNVPSGPQGPDNINFTIDVSTGPLATNGGYLVQNGVIVARNGSGYFMAVAAACTDLNESSPPNIIYSPANSNFICPNHGAQFVSDGSVTQGPATLPLKKYNTSLSGHMLRVYS